MVCQLIRVDFKKKSVKSKEFLPSLDSCWNEKEYDAWAADLKDVLLWQADGGVSLKNISVIVHNTDGKDGVVFIPANIPVQDLLMALESVKVKTITQIEEGEM